jgi:dephospho-CoA kinase
MFKLGLTGGIGSGKTLVSQIFDKLGVPVYNADSAARFLMDTDMELKAGVTKMFGEKAYGSGGLNRPYIARRVFGDQEKLARLNKLVHPRVREDFIRWTGQHGRAAYVVEEAAILFESGASAEMDQNVLVYAPEELRIKRVMDRDGLSREQVSLRMGHQLSDEEKKNMADHVLVNDGKRLLLPQVIELHNMILKRINELWQNLENG